MHPFPAVRSPRIAFGFIAIVLLAYFTRINRMPIFAADPWPAEVESPDFLPGCAALLLERPALLEGGHALMGEGESWLALGIGTAPLLLPDGRGQSEEDAYKAANAKALAALTEALFGARITGGEYSETTSRETPEGVVARERFRSMTALERSGLLAGSWEAGRWRLRSGREVGVLRAAAHPGHPLSLAAGHIATVSDTLDPEWREVVLSRPALRHGGVAAAVLNGQPWMLASGTVRIPKTAGFGAQNIVTVAEAKARVEWLRFVQGVRVNDRAEFTTELDRLRSESGNIGENIAEALSTSTDAQVRGWTGGMAPVGMWLADAGDHYRLAAVFRLSLADQPPGAAWPMQAPPIR